MKSKFDIAFPSNSFKNPFAVARIHFKKRDDGKYMVKVYCLDSNGKKYLLETNVCNDATNIRDSIICILRGNIPFYPTITHDLVEFINQKYVTDKARYAYNENFPSLLQTRNGELFDVHANFGEVIQVKLMDIKHGTDNIRNDITRNNEIQTTLTNAIECLYTTAKACGWKDFTFYHHIAISNTDHTLLFQPLTCRFKSIDSTTHKLEICHHNSVKPADFRHYTYMLDGEINNGHTATKKIVEQIENHTRLLFWEMTDENLLKTIQGIVNRMEKD